MNQFESCSKRARSQWFAALGPGLIVMLADTDAGSVITAAQSGAQWGYQLLLLQLILIPILYIVQELTVRLGLIIYLMSSGMAYSNAPYYGDHGLKIF